VEASALHAPSLTRVPLGAPLLRLRSDEQLLALFRAGSEDAFGAIHDRYRQRLFAYARQMLSAGPRQDAEDVLQDVFVRAYGALRADDREVNVRAWLYRVAHNRCIDHLRRPTPPPAEIFEMSRKPLHDPIEEAQRREDVQRLPEQQRSALLMREIDGMSYADLASALDVTVPAVKSLLVRARVGLVEAAEARDADCCEIRDDLMASYDRGVKASGRARRHMRSCTGCCEYREALRGMRRSFAALTPVSAGLFGSIAASLGIGGGGAAAGTAAAGGSGVAATAAGGTLATATACKVAAVVCTAALTAGGAVEVHKLKHHAAAPAAKPAAAAPARSASAVPDAVAVADQPVLHRTMSQPVTAGAPKAALEKKKAKAEEQAVVTPLAVGAPAEPKAEITLPVTAPPATAPTRTGGAAAPEQDEAVTQAPGTTSPGTTAPQQQNGTAAPDETSSSGTSGSGSQPSSGSDGGTPPSEH
jgi:RNA polymerase sigma factor (sigma-70 family)